MKKLALVILAGVSFATANAQFQFGVKGGLNFSSLYGSDIEDARTRVSLNAGIFARLPIAEHLSLMPELVYSSQGAKFHNPDESFPINYLNIPILLRFGAGGGFSIFTGPQIGILMSAKDKFNGNSMDLKDAYKSSDFSWVFGVGYRVPQTPVGIDFRYNSGISNIEEHDFNNSHGSIRNGVFQLGVTYVLFSSGR